MCHKEFLHNCFTSIIPYLFQINYSTQGDYLLDFTHLLFNPGTVWYVINFYLYDRIYGLRI